MAQTKRKSDHVDEASTDEGDGETFAAAPEPKKRGRPARSQPKQSQLQKGKSSVEKKKVIISPKKANKKRQAKPEVEAAPCIVCCEDRYKRFQWCQRHKNMYSVMIYQAQETDPPQDAHIKSMLDDPVRGPQLFISYEKSSVGLSKFKNGQAVKFGEWSKQWISKRAKLVIDDTKPYEQEEWILDKTNGRGWKREEAEEWWTDMWNGGAYEKGVKSRRRSCTYQRSQSAETLQSMRLSSHIQSPRVQ